MRNMITAPKVTSGAFNDIIRFRKYFGTVDGAATSIIRATEFNLFTMGQGQVDKNVSTNSDVTLLDCDTSLFGNQGIIPNSEKFTVFGIGVDIHLSNWETTTPFTDDSVTSINGTPLNTGSNPYPLVDFIRSQTTFELWRNSTELLEQGNIADYPCALSTAGFAGGNQAAVPVLGAGPAQAAYTQNAMVYAQNGMAFRRLTVYQVLDSLDQFYGKWKVCREIVLTGTKLCGYVDFLLVGRAEVNRASSQFVQPFA